MFIQIIIYYIIHDRKRVGWWKWWQKTQMTCVSCHLGHRCVFYILNSLCFCILTNNFLYLQVIIYIIHERKRVGWWKRWQGAQMTCVSCRLGHRCVCFFLNFIVFLYTNIILMYIQVIIYIIYDRKRVGQQWQWQRAQMTHISCQQWCHLCHSSWPPPNEAGDGGNNQQRREITTGLASETQHVSSLRVFFCYILIYYDKQPPNTRNCVHGHQHHQENYNFTY